MIWLRNITSDSGVLIERRAVKPLYARTQATVVTVEKVNGIDAQGVAPDEAEWVMSSSALLEVLRSATSPTAGWDAAKVLLEQGTPVYVGAGADGKLTVATSAPYLAKLVDVYERNIVIGGLTRTDPLNAAATALPEGKALGVAEKAPEASSFVGKPLDEIQSDVKLQMAGTTGIVTGTLTLTEWPEFGDPAADVPHHYIALRFQGVKGMAMIRRYEYNPDNRVNVFNGNDGDQVGDPATKLLVSFLPDADDTIVYDVYASEEDAKADKDPVRYTIDASKLIRK